MCVGERNILEKGSSSESCGGGIFTGVCLYLTLNYPLFMFIFLIESHANCNDSSVMKSAYKLSYLLLKYILFVPLLYATCTYK